MGKTTEEELLTFGPVKPFPCGLRLRVSFPRQGEPDLISRKFDEFIDRLIRELDLGALGANERKAHAFTRPPWFTPALGSGRASLITSVIAGALIGVGL